jgi:hypothetical protein
MVIFSHVLEMFSLSIDALAISSKRCWRVLRRPKILLLKYIKIQNVIVLFVGSRLSEVFLRNFGRASIILLS